MKAINFAVPIDPEAGNSDTVAIFFSPTHTRTMQLRAHGNEQLRIRVDSGIIIIIIGGAVLSP
jgi:hypothetical protein